MATKYEKLTNIRKFLLVVTLVANGYALAPAPAFAQGEATARLGDLITRLTNWALGLLIAISVLFVIYAAFLFLTAAGNEEQVKKAKQVILYAVVAIVVGLLSKAIVEFVKQLIGTA